MTTQQEPEIILYDLACIKDVCFSPSVWPIRQMLNYKRVAYKTVFLEFPDIEPTLKALGIAPHKTASASEPKYTVPAIYHVPTNTYMMDSVPISQFIESKYPDPPLQLTSELGSEVATKGRAVIGALYRLSSRPRELYILSPRAQEYFRRQVETATGKRYEDLLEPDKEDANWAKEDENIRSIGELMRTNKADGPFILGAQPSYTDFFVAGAMQCTRVIDEGVFQRNVKYPGFKEVYEACQPYMERRD